MRRRMVDDEQPLPSVQTATQQLIWLAQGAGEELACTHAEAGDWCLKHRLLHLSERYHAAVRRASERHGSGSMDPAYERLVGKTIADAGNAAVQPAEWEPQTEALTLRCTDGTTLRIDTTANVPELLGEVYRTP